jgi:hypothetical protein
LLAGNIIFLAQIWAKKLKVMREMKIKRDEEKERWREREMKRKRDEGKERWREREMKRKRDRYVATGRVPYIPRGARQFPPCGKHPAGEIPPSLLSPHHPRLLRDSPSGGRGFRRTTPPPPPAPRFLPQSSGGLAEDRWYPPWRVAIYKITLPPLLVHA